MVRLADAMASSAGIVWSITVFPEWSGATPKPAVSAKRPSSGVASMLLYCPGAAAVTSPGRNDCSGGVEKQWNFKWQIFELPGGPAALRRFRTAGTTGSSTAYVQPLGRPAFENSVSAQDFNSIRCAGMRQLSVISGS
jgi:hypothetical protein